MRLIDADALFEFAKTEEGAEILDHSVFKVLLLRRILDKAPTIEEEPVVRCGKCRYASDDIGAIARRYGKRGAVKCCNPNSIANNRLCLSDDFCSYGKEKE